MRKKLFFFFLIAVLSVALPGSSRGNQAGKQYAALKDAEPVGEFAAWGVTVPRSNYNFAKSAIMIFGTKWGAPPQTAEELEERVWEDLLLSFEAYRRGIKVEDGELKAEIDKLLKAEKAAFDRGKDPGAYAKWIKEKTGTEREFFENLLRHLIQLQKLRQQIMDSISPTVSEQEAYQEFLNEYNTLSVQLAQFDDAGAAKSYYAKVKNNPRLWDKEVADNPKLFRKPGFVAAEFLMEMWKLPKDDVYKMLKLKIGSVYPPIPIYGGKTAVCKVLEQRLADPSQFPKLKDSYYKQIEMKKKYDGVSDWIKKFKEEAKLKVYKNVEIMK
jgi:hypothetical protein